MRLFARAFTRFIVVLGVVLFLAAACRAQKGLSAGPVQAAVNEAVAFTQTGGSITVLGVREIPGQNEAVADLQFNNFQYNADFMKVPKPKNERTPQGDPAVVYIPPSAERMVLTYSGQGAASLTRYADGRWVLTRIDFNFVQITSNIPITARSAPSVPRGSGSSVAGLRLSASGRAIFNEQWNDLSQWVVVTGAAPTLAGHRLSTHATTDEIVTIYKPSSRLFRLYDADGDSTYLVEFKHVTINGPLTTFALIGWGMGGNFVVNYSGSSVACGVADGVPANHVCTDSPSGTSTNRISDTGISADETPHDFAIRIETRGALAGKCPNGHTFSYYVDGTLVDTVPVGGCVGNDDLDIKGLMSVGEVSVRHVGAR